MTEDKIAQAEARISGWVKRIKETADGKREADGRLDRESLGRAADLETLYTGFRWVDDLPAPKKVKGRGRKPDPRSREQFAKWVRKQFEWGSHQRLSQLHSAHNFRNSVAGIQPATEASVRPLWKLREQGYGEFIPQVWETACKLAGGQPPVAGETRRAVREFLDTHKAPVRNTAADDRTATEIRRARRVRLLAEFDALLAEENRTAKEALNEMIQHFNEHQRDLKAAS